VNYGPAVVGQTGRRFVPFDASIGRLIAKDVAISLEVGRTDHQGISGLQLQD
jgi:hypothetical protein